MSINFDLKANPREKLGSSESRRLRKAGNIPAVIYDKGKNTQVSIPTKEFEKEYYKGGIFTTVINLDIAGKLQKVIVNKIDLNPATDRPSHVTFIKAGDKVKVKVKVRFFNKERSPGIKKGGFLHVVTRKVELICPIDEIPEEVTHDIKKMRVGDKIRSSDLELASNIAFANKNDFDVASIIGRGAKEEEGESSAATEEGVEGEGGSTQEGGEKDGKDGGDNKEDAAKKD